MNDSITKTETPIVELAGQVSQELGKVISNKESETEKATLLVRAAELLHKYGTPSHRLEGVMKRVSSTLGIDADYLYTPTSLFVSFRKDHYRAQLLRVDAGPINLGKLAEFHDCLEIIESQEVPLSQCAESLEVIERQPPRFGFIPLAFVTGIASGTVTVFLGGGWAEMVTAICLGIVVQILNSGLNRWFPGERLFEFTAGFTCATLAILASAFIYPLDDKITTLASLIVILPGLSVTIAMTELAHSHLSSGVSRLAGAVVIFLTLAVGVALAWRLGGSYRPEQIIPTPLPADAKFWAALIAPLCFAIFFQARYQDWWKICPVAWLGFLATSLVQSVYGIEWGAFVGAAVIGILSNVYARFYKRPALILQMPAILLLVPGSLGYLSVTSFIDQQGLAGVESAFNMSLVAMALAGGLITANAVVAPKRFL
jgi:uncharacterized membrane protein YjjP (DUF1212 family)